MKDHISRFKRNDYSTFNEFYALTSKQVFFTAYGILKHKEAAEDIMQDTYVTLLNKIDEVKENQNIYAYLCMIARNKAINVYDSDKRILYDEEVIDYTAITNDDHSSIRTQEILSLLEDELDREIITYHVLFDYSFKEIAKIISKPLGTVLWKYNKAIKYLKEKMEGEEDE